MRRLLSLTILLLLFLPLAARAQGTKITLTGRVTDTTHAVVQKAQVVVTPGNYVTTSNELGEFLIQGLTPGQYTVTVTSTGFAPFTKSITIAVGQPAVLEAALQVNSANEQVVVNAEGGKDMIEAINEEITSANILNVMPEARILSLPNANVADAIGRLPGVTVQRDEGEAVYVQVRGLDPRLTNVTIDGVTVPSPESSVRQVLLATIPADMVQSLELNKTLSASQDADGIGGLVNIVTKMAGEAPTFNFSSTLGMSPIENDRYMGQVDTTLGKRFGATHRFGVILSAGYDYNGRGYNDIEPQPDLNPDFSTTPYYDSIDIREYRHQRLRWGGSMGADYKVNEHSSLHAHFILSDFKDWGDKWTYTIQTNDKPKFKYSVRRPDFSIGSLSIGGNHTFGNKWGIWGMSVSRSRELGAAGNPGMSFNPTSALKSWAKSGTNCNFVGPQNGNQYLPQWESACMTPNADPTINIFNLSNYIGNQYNGTTGQSVTLNLQPWGSVGLNYHIGHHAATLELGGEFRSSHKFQNAYTPTFDNCSQYPGVQSTEPGVPGEYPGDPGANCTVPTPDINAGMFQGGFTDPNYYSGHYHMGPTTDHYTVDKFVAANASIFPLDINATRSSSDPANFNLDESVSAGYIMNTINWDHFRLQTGIRFEATHEYGLGNVVNIFAGPNGDGIDNNGNWIGTTAVTTTEDYIDPLPSVQLRYAANSRTAIRAVYARGISRPNQYDLVPYISPSGGTNNIWASIGNPAELPTHANNYDLLLEQQLKPFGLIQAGFFYKQLTNPIVAANVPCNAACQAASGAPPTGALATQNINGNNASVYGFEVSWQQKFSTLPSALSGLGIAANYSANISQINGLPNRTDSPALVGAAPYAFNIEPEYEYRRYSANLGISYNAANIATYQYADTASGLAICNNGANPNPNGPLNGPINGPCGDNYYYPHLQIDAQVGMRIYKGLELKLQGLNLNNEVFGFYNGSPQYMTQREYYKPTYEATLRWTSAHSK